jgi:hypothetical protein
MTSKDIKKYIDRLNIGRYLETIFIRPISKNISVAKVWPAIPKISDPVNIGCPSYTFFFIKNEDQKFVGAVLDMNSDLHWFVTRQYRKKGYLTTALKNVILPYLLDDKDAVRITISKGLEDEDYSNSKKVALAVGFKPLDSDETIFEIKTEEFDSLFDDTFDQNTEITPERILLLRRRVSLMSKLLYQISDELSMAYYDDQGLHNVAAEVSYFNTKIDDIAWKYQKNVDE